MSSLVRRVSAGVSVRGRKAHQEPIEGERTGEEGKKVEEACASTKDVKDRRRALGSKKIAREVAQERACGSGVQSRARRSQKLEKLRKKKNQGSSRGSKVQFASKVTVEMYEVPKGDRPVSQTADDIAFEERRRIADRKGRSAEYVREVELFDAIQDWCRKELDDSVFDGSPIGGFLTRCRTIEAEANDIWTFDDLVERCEEYVHDHMYKASPEEVSIPSFGIQTEEILTSLVRDFLQSFLTYGSSKKEKDCMCHDCFHIGRALVLRRRAKLAQQEEKTKAK